MRVPSRNGAALQCSSTLNTTATILRALTRPRRLRAGNSVRCRGFRVRRLFGTVSRGGLALRRPSKMASPGGSAQQGVWHFSHGFVFANDTRVVYPKLPSVRHYVPAPAQAPAPQDDGASGFAVGNLEPGVTDVQVASAGVAGEEKTSVVNPASVRKATDVLAATEETVTAVVPSEETATDSTEAESWTIPVQPLEYKIPEEIFEAARQAPEGSPQSFWSYSLYRGPAGEDGAPGPKVKVHYCTSERTTERVIRNYFMDEKILGFDLEWSMYATKAGGVRKNVSLVQIASESRIALFHYALFSRKDNFAVPALKEILENPEITKVGIWIKGDASRLRTWTGIDSRSIFELSHLYRLVEHSRSRELKPISKRLVSMADQVKTVLHLPIFKGDVRISDWSQPLHMDQIIYSASDAYAAVQLYAALNHARLNLVPVPPLPHHAELNLPIRPAEQEPIDSTPDADPTASTAFAQYADTLGENSVVDEDFPEPGSAEEAPVTKTPRKPKQLAVPQLPKDPRVEEADIWARQRVVGRPIGEGVTATRLRAYYLWHKNEELDAEDVAKLLRDPPLATSTVVGYISSAIRLEGLPFEGRKLREQVVEKLPPARRVREITLLRLCRTSRVSEGGPLTPES